MAQNTISDQALQAIARKLVSARRTASPLGSFPGEIPPDLATAYRVQDYAIDLWPDSIVGWKVGQIRPSARAHFGTDRMIGPLFSRHVRYQERADVPETMELRPDGFAAIEAEFIAVINADAPADKLQWTPEESMGMIGELRIGIETAGGPLPGIADMGSAAVVCDFGAHEGLIVGPSIADWQSRALDSLTCEAFVEDQSVGKGGALLLNEGYVRSMQVALEITAQRGRPLKAGDLVSTGAATGVHHVSPGQNAHVAFGDDGTVSCTIAATTPIS